MLSRKHRADEIVFDTVSLLKSWHHFYTSQVQSLRRSGWRNENSIFRFMRMSSFNFHHLFLANGIRVCLHIAFVGFILFTTPKSTSVQKCAMFVKLIIVIGQFQFSSFCQREFSFIDEACNEKIEREIHTSS